MNCHAWTRHKVSRGVGFPLPVGENLDPPLNFLPTGSSETEFLLRRLLSFISQLISRPIDRYIMGWKILLQVKQGHLWSKTLLLNQHYFQYWNACKNADCYFMTIILIFKILFVTALLIYLLPHIIYSKALEYRVLVFRIIERSKVKGQNGEMFQKFLSSDLPLPIFQFC